MHKRPVICANIGGMAEKVGDGVNGLHFLAGDAFDLAAVIRRAVTTPGLWERLQEGIPNVYSISEAVKEHAAIYGTLMNRNGKNGHIGKG